MTTIKRFNEFRLAHPTEKIVVISQDTYRNRFTYLSSRTNDYEGIPTNKVDGHILKQNPDSAEVLRFTDKYITDEQMDFSFYLSCVGARSHVESYGGLFLNFTIYNHLAKYSKDTNLGIISMRDTYLNSLSVFPRGVTNKIKAQYEITRKEMTLPCWHLKRQYHELIANAFVEAIE